MVVLEEVAITKRENRASNEVGIKVIVRGNKKLTCLASATEEEINQAFIESEQMDKAERRWEEKGKLWTKDDESFLDRMSS